MPLSRRSCKPPLLNSPPMKKLLLVSWLVACAAPQKNSPPANATANANSTTPTPKNGMSYPKSRVDEIQETLHGVAVADPYRWLEDEKSDEVKAWMAQQDRLAREHIAKLPGRDRLAARMKELFYLDS